MRMMLLQIWHTEVFSVCLPSLCADKFLPDGFICPKPPRSFHGCAALRVLRLYTDEAGCFKPLGLGNSDITGWLRVVAAACPALAVLAVSGLSVTSLPPMPALRHLILEVPCVTRPLLASLAPLTCLLSLRVSDCWHLGRSCMLDLIDLCALQCVLMDVFFFGKRAKLDLPRLILCLPPKCRVAYKAPLRAGAEVTSSRFQCSNSVVYLQAARFDMAMPVLLGLDALRHLKHLHVGSCSFLEERRANPADGVDLSCLLVPCLPSLETATFELASVWGLLQRYIRVPANLRSLTIVCHDAGKHAPWGSGAGDMTLHVSVACTPEPSPGLQRLWLRLSAGRAVSLAFDDEPSAVARLCDLAIKARPANTPHSLGPLLAAKVAQCGQENAGCVAMGTQFRLGKGGRAVLPCHCGTCVECLAPIFGGRVEVMKDTRLCMVEPDLADPAGVHHAIM